MAHNRKLVIGGVSLVKARLRHDIQAMAEVRDELEPVLAKSDFFAGAPFTWVGLVIRFGLENNAVPSYRPVNKTHGDLPVAIEIDVQPLIRVEEVVMKRAVRKAALTALLHVADKFKLDSSSLKAFERRLDLV